MKKIFICFLTGILLLTCASTSVISQESESKSNINLGADVMSRYIWRGTDFGNAPAIQPTVSYSIAGFEIGAWGAYSIGGAGFQEADLYASYTFLKDMFTLGATDYFFPAAIPNNKYFDYDDKTTNHVLEGNFSFNGTDKIPLTFAANYNFWGWNKDNSWYFEVGFNGSVKQTDYNIFMGFTPDKGIYMPDGSTGFSVVNVGLSASREVKITDSFSLPLQASLITNPQAQNIFLVFGFSL